jgi:hypothetical protein
LSNLLPISGDALCSEDGVNHGSWPSTHYLLLFIIAA